MIKKLLYSWFSPIGFAIIIILSLTCKVTYGYGLGDMLFIFGIVLCFILSVNINYYFTQKVTRNNKVLIYSLILSLLVMAYCVYGFTIGRGAENRWDGVIFQ